jgi:hypothetical protein
MSLAPSLAKERPPVATTTVSAVKVPREVITSKRSFFLISSTRHPQRIRAPASRHSLSSIEMMRRELSSQNCWPSFFSW